jgi:SCP-2 sterol transfer family protein
MLRLRTLVTSQSEQPWSATYEVRLGRYRFTVQVVDGELVDLSRGEPHEPAGTIVESDPDTLARLRGVDQARTKAIKDRRLAITGNAEAAQRLFQAVRIPEQ